MSINCINRLIIASGVQNHQLILNYLKLDLGIPSEYISNKKNHIRVKFPMIQRSATAELQKIHHQFPTLSMDLIWSDDSFTFAKAISVEQGKFHPQVILQWGIQDYLNIESFETDEPAIKETVDWLAMEYDLIRASQSGGFFTGTKIIPVVSFEEYMEILDSEILAPHSPSANAVVLKILSENIDPSEVPTQYLSSDIFEEAFYARYLGFPSIPKEYIHDDFVIQACAAFGEEVFIHLAKDELTEDICIAAINARWKPISLKDIPSQMRSENVCAAAIWLDVSQFKHVPKKIVTQEFCNRFPHAIAYIPSDFKTVNLCWDALEINASLLAFVPKPFITKSLLAKLMRQKDHHNTFLKYVPKEFLNLGFIKKFLRKNPKEFQYIPEEFITPELTKQFVLRDIENLPFASSEAMETLLKHRTIRRNLINHPDTFQLLPKAYLSSEVLMSIYKLEGINFDEIPNHFITEEMIQMAVRKIKYQHKKDGITPVSFKPIAKSCTKIRVWKLSPLKIKDYDFCVEAIESAHHSIEADILVKLLEQTPIEEEYFIKSIQYLYTYLDKRMSVSFKEKYRIYGSLSEYVEKVLDGSDFNNQRFLDLVSGILHEIPHSKRQRAAYEKISIAAWELWLAISHKLYPYSEPIQLEDQLVFNSSTFINCTQQVKILNLYLHLGENGKLDLPLDLESHFEVLEESYLKNLDQ